MKMGGDRALPLLHTQGCLFPPGDRGTRMLSCSQTTNGSWPSFLQTSGRKTSVLASHLVESRTKSPAEGWMDQIPCRRLDGPSPLQKAGWRVYPASAAVQGCVQKKHMAPSWGAPLGSIGGGQAKKSELGHAPCVENVPISYPGLSSLNTQASPLALTLPLPAHTCFPLACFKLLVAVHPF